MPDMKISEFPSGGSLENGDYVAGVRDGANTKFLIGIGSDIGDIPMYEDDGSGDPILLLGTIDTLKTNLWSKQQVVPSVTLSAVGGEIDWDLETAQNANHVASGNVTLNNPTNMQNGGVYSFRWVQSGSTPYTLAFDSAYKFNGGTPAVSNALNSVMEFTFKSDGSFMRGSYNLYSS